MKALYLAASVAAVASLGAVAVLFGCGEPIGGCTEAGCTDEVRIALEDADGEPVEGFEGEMTFDGETIEFECEADGEPVVGEDYNCGDATLVLVKSPDEVELSVTSGELEAEVTLTPEYDKVHPNGEDCPPTCHQTDETVTLEEAS